MAKRIGVLILLVAACAWAQRPTSAGAKIQAPSDPALVAAGKAKFAQNCAFCHGRDAGGGESGPNLTRSSAVLSDRDGDKVGEVVHNGRPGRMPKFDLPPEDIRALAAFLHFQAANANSEESQRRKIGLQDLLTGNADAGKTFFNDRCAQCHSPAGDLAGIAKKYDPIPLESVMLYPRDPPKTATVTLASGEQISGRLEHLDEFTVSVRGHDGWQHSWPRQEVKIKVDDPASAHLKLLPAYTDKEIHDVFAYLETLR